MKYYVGIDAGTNSIGYAVTDPEYHVLKFKGNAMWGVRCFESGDTAQKRRLHRNERRRNQRKKYRLDCLEMLFNEEVAKKDIAFFQRLKDSALYQGDKKVAGKYSLFNDQAYNDADYHKDFPTIYHLRKELIENSNPHDVRLVYLAVSHIIKNRGHFLFESYQPMSEGNSNFRSIFQEFNQYLEDNYDKRLDCDDPMKIAEILKNKTLSPTKKKEKLNELFHLNKKEHSFEIAVITLLAGNQVNAKDLFQSDEYEDSECKKITFKNSYDENSIKYEETFHEKFELIVRIKAIFDWALLADLMNGEQYISYAKVKQYEKHHSDLCLLKDYVKKHAPSLYGKIFNTNHKDVNNYLKYTGHSKKQPLAHRKCLQEEFCAFLKKELPKEHSNDNDSYKTMFQEIENNTFMPKIVSKDNSVIPMQINQAELEAILENAQAYLPFLRDVDETGKSVKEKIIDIFAFRIPYYIGPLNRHSDKSWLERNAEKIYPWNFQQVVDELKSAENFIQNLTSKCTYLHKEDVIPKCSLLYSSFMVLNELNNVRIDGELLSVEDKQNIYNELFLKKGKGTITKKKIEQYFISNGYVKPIITGMDQQFKSNLKPYHDLKNFALSDTEKEEIIKAITIFGDDKKLLKKRLKNQYGDKLSEDDINKISKLSYKGWSRLSKKLLIGIHSVLPESGEYTNIMHALWETNDNLMQLLSKSYQFKEEIDKENKDIRFTSLREEIDSLYVSPKIRRSIYQTMKIIEEIVKIHGSAPAKIFIEMARGEEEKVRTVSRKERLLALYKNCKETEKELYESLKKTNEEEFQRDRLFLYYTQFGRCMYTNTIIQIEDLYNNNIYDIDHIFPRSKVKDDSLDNRVLVLKTANEKKDNDYPICKEWRDRQKDFWHLLLDKGLISQKKYERLTRSTPLTEDELNDFTNRQLVETRQSTKATAELLKKRYPDTAIEYIKAGLVSDFRYHHEAEEDQFVKCRDVNDLHHAKDAYLNIVVGNVYTTKAKQKYFIQDLQQGKISMNRIFDYSIKGAWNAENNQSMNIVRATMAKNNIRFTRYAYKKHGQLFDVTLLKKGNGQVPIKKGMDIAKYGGYNKATCAYFAFVAVKDKNGCQERYFVPIDLYIEKEYLENPKSFVAKYLDADADQVRIIVPCIKIDSLIEVDGFPMHISSKSGPQLVCKPAMQLILSEKQERYIKKIANFIKKCEGKEKEPMRFDKISKEENIELYDILMDKLTNTKFNVMLSYIADLLSENRNTFTDLSLFKQCDTLMEIIKILHANPVRGNLTAINGNKRSGKISLSMHIQSKYQSVKLIYQSITGLFTQEIDLLK